MLSWAGGDGEWDADCEAIGGNVHVKARGGGSTAVLFIHGSDPDRSASSYEAFLENGPRMGRDVAESVRLHTVRMPLLSVRLPRPAGFRVRK